MHTHYWNVILHIPNLPTFGVEAEKGQAFVSVCENTIIWQSHNLKDIYIHILSIMDTLGHMWWKLSFILSDAIHLTSKRELEVGSLCEKGN